METFAANGNSPYRAIRESYVKASAFLSSLNGEFSNGVHAQGEEEVEDTEGEVERKDQENDLEDDESSRQSGQATGDEEVEEEGGDEDHNYVVSVQSFWEKALAKKCSDCPVTYEVREEGEEVIVTCSVGQLMVEGEGTMEEEARQSAAASMLNKMEEILQSGRDIVQIIKTGRETKQDSANPPFRDETVFSEEEEEENQRTKHAGNAYEEEVVGSSDEEMAVSSEVVAGPVTKAADSRPLETEMMPGAEYCLSLVRTDKPGE